MKIKKKEKTHTNAEAEPDDLPKSKNVIQPVLKAVRAKCLDCCCGQEAEVRRCAITDCSLHPYRFGTNPFSKRGDLMTDEDRKARSERMKQRWAERKAKGGA